MFEDRSCMDVIGSQDNSGGPQEVSSPASWTKQSQLWSDAVAQGFIRSESQRLAMAQPAPPLDSWWKCFSLYPVWTTRFNLSLLFLVLLPTHWTAWLHRLGNLPVGTGRLLLGPTQSHLLCRLNKPGSLSLSSQDKGSSPQPSWWLSAELAAVYWGPKTEHSILGVIWQALREHCWLLCSLLPGKAPVAASQLQPGHIFTV